MPVTSMGGSNIRTLGILLIALALGLGVLGWFLARRSKLLGASIAAFMAALLALALGAGMTGGYVTPPTLF